MRIDIITAFPNIFDSYLEESIIKKARAKGLIKVFIHDLRRWAKDKRRTIDDRPYGGGLGMVIKIEPVYLAVQSLKQKTKNKSASRRTKVILFTPRGKQFNQKTAYKLSGLDRIILICGRYEGVDERAAKKIADMEMSLGPYDLMGGEVAAMAVLEAVSRLIPGVLGKPELLKERITKKKGFVEYPQYTRPEAFKGWKVPKVLLSGNHKQIEEWRRKRQKAIE